MKNTKQTYLLLLYMLSSPIWMYGQYFKHLDMKDGLSNPSVLSIYQDTLGRMWFGSNEGVNVYDGKEIQVYKSYDVNGGAKYINQPVEQIVGDSRGNIFLLCGEDLLHYSMYTSRLTEIQSGGVEAITVISDSLTCVIRGSLFQYDVTSDSLSFRKKLHISNVSYLVHCEEGLAIGTIKGLYLLCDGKVSCVLPDVEIFKLFVSSSGDLWIGTRFNGLYRRKKNGDIQKIDETDDKVVSKQIRGFAEDGNGNIWFGTFNGLQMYNPYKDSFKVYHQSHLPGMLKHQSVFSLYKDRQGTIWVGTYYGGVNYFNLLHDIFHYYLYDGHSEAGLSYPIVGEMIEDKDHDVWICTDGGGLNRYCRKEGTFQHFKAGGYHSILRDNLKSIAYDKVRDCIYVGTYTGGLSRFDRKSGHFYNYLSHRKEPGDRVFHIQIQGDYLYISSTEGFWRMHLETEEFQCLIPNGRFSTFLVDTYGTVWLSTSANLYILKLNGSDSRPVPFVFEVSTVQQPKVTKILETKDGMLYIATMGHGVYAFQPLTKEWEHLTEETHNLLSNCCYNLLETPEGNLLLSGDKGVSIYNKITQVMYSFDLGFKGGISAVTDGCGLLAASDGKIYVGGVDGMISFHERDLIKERVQQNNLYFSDLFINNAKVFPGDETGILKVVLPFEKEIELDYDQNNFTVYFSNTDYVEYRRSLKYHYMLEGFDRTWNATDQLRLNYTNLSPGEYVLKVKEVNSNSGNNEVALRIFIHRPWFVTWWAWLIYLVIFAGLFLLVANFLAKRRTLMHSLALEREEKLHMEELSRIKLRFFTNISHEFRTPLTLIIGQIEVLMQAQDLPLQVYRRLQRIYRNAMNLRILITELLDFRKQEQGFMALKVSCVDAVVFVKEAFKAFSELAAHRHITYVFETAVEKMDVWCDAAQMQKVLYNLLSNAFKYTPKRGRISVKLSIQSGKLQIAVSDTGCGIKDADQEKIFDRFYCVGKNTSEAIQGSGIGLSFTKAMIEAHHGTIMVESVWGKGSCFKIELLQGNLHFNAKELEDGTMSAASSSDWQEMLAADTALLKSAGIASGVNDTETEKTSVLLVEDSEEMMELLEDIFQSSYKVYKAYNGQEGLELALKYSPDIIVSDVMMPVMSGKEMCYKIKNSLKLAYIPIVLLTAQVSDEHAIEGYQFGADVYISKPFNVRLLLTCCANLLANKRKLIQRVFETGTDSNGQHKGLCAVDSKLLNEANRIIRENFDNPDFNMDMLASQLNMGRSKMYARLKDLTGLTPNEYVMKLKLEEALRLIQEDADCNISEISYQLGFSSPRYFSRCFKDFYGMAPLNFRKKTEGNMKEEQ